MHFFSGARAPAAADGTAEAPGRVKAAEAAEVPAIQASAGRIVARAAVARAAARGGVRRWDMPPM
ncbi:hypothetical protein GCM10010343_28880 [Streptomyces avidinii]|nr:hypothetical protein GCM10010343_28880 [Streptomyces avidinii]